MATIRMPKVPNHPSESTIFREIAEAVDGVIERLRAEYGNADELGFKSLPNVISHIKQSYHASLWTHWRDTLRVLGRDAPLADVETSFLDSYSSYVARHSEAAARNVESLKPEHFSPKEYTVAKAIAERCAVESAAWNETVDEIVGRSLDGSPTPAN